MQKHAMLKNMPCVTDVTCEIPNADVNDTVKPFLGGGDRTTCNQRTPYISETFLKG